MIKHKKNHNPEEMKDLDNETKNNISNEEPAFDPNAKEKAGAVDEQVKEALEIKKLQEELGKKTKEIETLTDTMKRRQADFENYKKRMVKTQDEQKKLAIRDFAFDIIHINDDLIRAFESSCSINREKPVDEICNTFSEGFSMISKRLEETLKKYGIKEIDSLNKSFDPNCNEAIEMEDCENVEFDTITKVHQKGFRLDEYVIRPAKVKVTRPKKQDNNGIKSESNDFKNDDVNDVNKTGENINFKA
jgi:molecular chaperone GrpE